MSARAKSPVKASAKAVPSTDGNVQALELKLKAVQDAAAADAQQRNYAQLERVRDTVARLRVACVLHAVLSSACQG